jgi:hypothetical protein
LFLFIGVEKKKIVSPVVSPGWVKMGALLISRDDRDSDSRRLNAAVCAQLMTISEFLQECRFRL